MAPQVDEPTYIYEQQPGGSVLPSQPQPAHLQHVSAATESIMKRSVSVDRDAHVTGDHPQPQTVYVEQTSEDAEPLRYTGTQVRYEEDVYHQRYEYTNGGQHPGPHPDVIKVEMDRTHNQQTEIHIYENCINGQRQQVVEGQVINTIYLFVITLIL